MNSHARRTETNRQSLTLIVTLTMILSHHVTTTTFRRFNTRSSCIVTHSLVVFYRRWPFHGNQKVRATLETGKLQKEAKFKVYARSDFHFYFTRFFTRFFYLRHFQKWYL